MRMNEYKVFGHHYGLQQPRNNVFRLTWALAKSTQSSKNRSVDFIGGLSDKNRAESERWQNFEELELLDTIFYMIM